MADDNTPKLKVLITPQFGENKQATNFLICLTVECPALRKDSTLGTFPTNFAALSTQLELQASDEEGELPIVSTDPKESEQCLGRRYMTLRNTYGDVEIRYKVLTSSKDQFKTGEPILGLHGEKGGLLGSGFAIVAVTPSEGACRNIVEWDLAGAPRGTRAVWTYGEGPLPVERIGPASILRDSVYMMGRIQSHPPAVITGSKADDHGYYWFGYLPPNIEPIKNAHQAFFTRAQKSFELDNKSVKDFDHRFFANVPEHSRKCLVESTPHRSFIRNTGSTKSFGGTSFGHSHIFNYDDQIGKARDFDLVHQVTYEMTHIWLGPSVVDGVDWLYEGIKNCLAISMQLRYKGMRGGYVQSTIDMLCTRYYTSPLINLPFEDVLKLAGTDTYAKEHVSARAWAFVFGVDLRARQLSKNELDTARPIEDIAMIPLVNNKTLGKAHGIVQWMELLTPLMGDELQQRYEEFCMGTTILPIETLYGTKDLYLKQVDNLILDFGMDRESFTEGVIRGLKAGSRAEIAGLRNGDKIVWSSHEWRCVNDSRATMELLIEREDVQRRVKYLPRCWDSATNWEVLKRDKQEIKEHEKFLREEEQKEGREKGAAYVR